MRRDHHAANLNSIGLLIGMVGPIIAEMNKIMDQHLAPVGRVGKHFLVTRHGGIEAKLTSTETGIMSYNPTFKNATILEVQGTRC
jgi:hypothetical protein